MNESKCYSVSGASYRMRLFYNYERGAKYYFCAKPGSFRLVPTSFNRPNDPITPLTGVFVLLLKPNGEIDMVPSFFPGICWSGHSLKQEEYRSLGGTEIYEILGGCNGCSCDARTHCRIPCLGTPDGYCCIERQEMINRGNQTLKMSRREL